MKIEEKSVPEGGKFADVFEGSEVVQNELRQIGEWHKLLGTSAEHFVAARWRAIRLECGRMAQSDQEHGERRNVFALVDALKPMFEETVRAAFDPETAASCLAEAYVDRAEVQRWLS